MKLFLADSWIDDHSVISNLEVRAGTLYTAAAKAAKITKQRNFRPGSRKQKLTVRVHFVSAVKVL